MRQDRTAVDVDFISNRHVVAQHRHILQSRPFTYRAIPTDDRRLHPCVVLDLTTSQEHASMQPNAIADYNVRADGHIRSNATVAANLCARIDEHVAAMHERLTCRSKGLGALIRK